MSIIIQVEEHKLFLLALLQSIMGQNWSIICQGLATISQHYLPNDSLNGNPVNLASAL